MVWIRLARGGYQWRTAETQESTSGFDKMRAVCGLSEEQYWVLRGAGGMRGRGAERLPKKRMSAYCTVTKNS